MKIHFKDMKEKMIAKRKRMSSPKHPLSPSFPYEEVLVMNKNTYDIIIVSKPVQADSCTPPDVP